VTRVAVAVTIIIIIVIARLCLAVTKEDAAWETSALAIQKFYRKTTGHSVVCSNRPFFKGRYYLQQTYAAAKQDGGFDSGALEAWERVVIQKGERGKEPKVSRRDFCALESFRHADGTTDWTKLAKAFPNSDGYVKLSPVASLGQHRIVYAEAYFSDGSCGRGDLFQYSTAGVLERQILVFQMQPRI